MSLAKQQKEPHPQLASVRLRIEQCGKTRGEAAALCNHLTDGQCESILSAKDDKAVENALKPAKKVVAQAIEATTEGDAPTE